LTEKVLHNFAKYLHLSHVTKRILEMAGNRRWGETDLKKISKIKQLILLNLSLEIVWSCVIQISDDNLNYKVQISIFPAQNIMKVNHHLRMTVPMVEEDTNHRIVIVVEPKVLNPFSLLQQLFSHIPKYS
jgi:hypothetical protein